MKNISEFLEAEGLYQSIEYLSGNISQSEIKRMTIGDDEQVIQIDYLSNPENIQLELL